MNPDFDKLAAEVAEITSVVDSAVALIAGMAQGLRDAVAVAADFAALQAAIGAQADSLDAAGSALAAAVAANTPAAPPAPETPVVPEP